MHGSDKQCAPDCAFPCDVVMFDRLHNNKWEIQRRSCSFLCSQGVSLMENDLKAFFGTQGWQALAALRKHGRQAGLASSFFAALGDLWSV